MNYREQLELVLSYRVREGQSYRGDCPSCGGRNTFAIKLRSGELSWGCFRASCDVGGIRSGELSSVGILAKMSNEQPSARLLAPIPSMLTPASNKPKVMKFLEEYHSLEAYEMGLVDIKYAPTEDRVMFPVLDPEVGVPIGYTGRAKKNVRPKWKKYGDCSSLFTCGTGKIAVVVEDCLSACAVGVVKSYTGTALLGTILTQTHISELRKFDKVIVAVDPDANQKGLKMTSSLIGTVPTTMRLIPNDLKYYDKYKIMEILDDD